MMTTPSQSLPTEDDFDPWLGNLDAQSAWKNFGGLTLSEAHAKFRENPLHYQEAFMWMGGKAFAYYFPVIEDYLRSVPDGEHEDDHEARILAACIEAQFEPQNRPHVQHLAENVLALAQFVQENIRRFGASDKERRQVARAWEELAQRVW